MSDLLTIEELAQFTGESRKRLQAWQAAGLIGRDGLFRRGDVGCAKLVHDLLHHGFTVPQLAEAAKQPGSALSRYLETLNERWQAPTLCVEGAAQRAGIDAELARRLMYAAGIAEQGDMLTEEDLGLFKTCKIVLESGYPEHALLQILRVYSDAMNRVAEVENRTSHFYVHERMVEEGWSRDDIQKALDNASDRLNPLVEPSILYFHRKGVEKAEWEDILMHLEEDSGLAERPTAPGQIRRAVMFIDLANFTPLAEAMGDERAAEVLERFAEIVRHANIRCHGRVVKQIGDAFMVVFPEPYSAVSCALEVEEAASKEPHFPPVRAGINWGPLLYREGDYVGSNVNIASRLAAEANRHQVLMTADVWTKAKELPGAEFTRLGRRKLKGIAREIEVYEARSGGKVAPDRRLDPVCGMELSPSEAAATLMLDGLEHWFHSDDCLRKFVKDPGKYVLAELRA